MTSRLNSTQFLAADSTMRGYHAFCPKTGASLSKKRHYDERGRPQRVPTDDVPGVEPPTDGELTNGAISSSKRALLNYFRRCHQRHHDADQRLYRKASLGLTRLKRAANGIESWDVHVWYALGEWLSETGYDVEWMRTHVEPRCPHCAGRLKYEAFPGGEVIAQCGTNCTDDYENRLRRTREIVAGLYARAFDATADERTIEQLELL